MAELRHKLQIMLQFPSKPVHIYHEEATPDNLKDPRNMSEHKYTYSWD
jgi:hypothetical protein